MKRRLIAFALALCMTVGLLPMAVFADEVEEKGNHDSKYYIVFDGNGGYFGNEQKTENKVEAHSDNGGQETQHVSLKSVMNSSKGYVEPKRADGAQLLGWSTTKDGSVLDKHYEIELNGDVRLYAVWGPVTPPAAVTVTFKVVNGTWSDGASADISAEVGEDGRLSAGQIPAGMLAAEGYDQSSGAWQAPAPNTETQHTENGTVYTYSFAPVPVVEYVSVRFVVVNGTWDGSDNADKTVTLVKGGKLTDDLIPAGMQADEGYHGGAWDVTPSVETAHEADLTIYTFSFEKDAQELPKHAYGIIYHANFEGADPERTTDSENVRDVTDTSKTFSVDGNSFVRSGYTFQGWATSAEGTVAYQKDAAVTLTAENPTLELYAVWKQDPVDPAKYSYAITYHANYTDANPAAKADSENTDSEKTSVEFHADPADTFKREGYTFKGWKTGDGKTTYSPGDAVKLTSESPKLDLYAVWEAVNKPTYDYSIIYHANFKDADPALKTDSENKKGSEAASREFEVDGSRFDRKGYTFLGWAKSDDGKVAYKGGESVVLKSDKPLLNLYAVWAKDEVKEEKEYSLTYHANAGDDEVTKMPSPRTQVKKSDDGSVSFKVPSTRPKRDGYYFLYWNTKAHGGGTKVRLGETYVVNDTNGPDEHLYAIWTPVDPDNPKTGDLMMNWMLLMTLAAAGLAVTAAYSAKRKRR